MALILIRMLWNRLTSRRGISWGWRSRASAMELRFMNCTVRRYSARIQDWKHSK